MPPYYKLVLLMVVVFGCAFIFTLAGSLAMDLFYGINMFSDPAALGNLEDEQVVSALKLLQVISATGTFIVPSLLGAWLLFPDASAFLGINRKPSFKILLMVAGVVVVSIPFINWLLLQNEGIRLPEFLQTLENWMKSSEANAAAITDAFMKMPAWPDFVFNLFMIGLIPAVGEELLFRGMLQPLIKGVVKNVFFAVLFTSVLFSAMHLQFYGFLPRLLLGLILGFLYEWSKSIWLPFFMHFLNNSGAVIIAYLYPGVSMDEAGTGEGQLWQMPVSLFLTAFLLLAIRRLSRAEAAEPPDDGS